MIDKQINKNAVIVISGGMDSTTLLYEYQDEIALAVTFDYGSLQNAHEREFAILHCKRLGIKHLIIPLDFMHRHFKSSLLGSPDDIPEGDFLNAGTIDEVVARANARKQ